MNPPDKGLLLSSRVDFTIPSPFAREHLYYLIQYRRYQCVPVYEVKRDFLICTWRVCAQRFAARLLRRAERGRCCRTLVLMDCRLPTGTASPSRPSFWFHFSGGESAASTGTTLARVFRSRKHDAEQIPLQNF
ncbi:MAG: hypothetical protein ACLT4C_06520 [Butyricicoccus sp.]